MRWLAVMGLAVAACTSSTLPPPVAQTHVGPGNRPAIHRVLALPATCGSLYSFAELRPEKAYTEGACSRHTLDGVDAAVRTMLAFRGLDVVDSETVNATTLARTEVTTSTMTGHRSSTSEKVKVRGSRFADAPPAIQDAILDQLGADAVLGVRIFVGAGTGISGRRHIDVLVRLLDFRNGELVWASRCRVEAGLVFNDAPIMQAARCATAAAKALGHPRRERDL